MQKVMEKSKMKKKPPKKQLTGIPQPERPLEIENIGDDEMGLDGPEPIGIQLTHKVKSSGN